MAGEAGRPRDVFVSYRRADTNFVVGHLVDRLDRELGEDRIFRDLDSIPYGTDYRQHTGESLATCAAALVVIGPNWVGATPEGRRIDDPTDLVRVEAEAVLARGIPVIPVLVEPAVDLQHMPLPAGLDALRYRQAMPLRPDPDFDTDVNRIARVLRQMIGPEPPPPPPPAPAPAIDVRPAPTPPTAPSMPPRRRGAGKILLGMLAVAIVVVGVVVLVTQRDDDDGSDGATPRTTGEEGDAQASDSACDVLRVSASGRSNDEVLLVLENSGNDALDLPSSTALSFVASDGAALGVDPGETGLRGGWFAPFTLPGDADMQPFVVVTPALNGRGIDRVIIDGVMRSNSFGFPTLCSYDL